MLQTNITLIGFDS